MKKVKDHFSAQSKLYARFRPHYPDELYAYLFDLVSEKEAAWDCGTGNGQVAIRLSEKFARVYATDISERQVTYAQKWDNVQYFVCRAEKTDFEVDTFNLITVGQALHWFDFKAFFQEVKRTSKNNAILAVWGYRLLKISDEIDPLIYDFYRNKVGPYWDQERKYVDEGYQNVPFPFEEIKAPEFTIKVRWTLAQLEGFLNTWSSVQKYMKQKGENPVPGVMKKIRPLWQAGQPVDVKFPVFMRVGKVK